MTKRLSPDEKAAILKDYNEGVKVDVISKEHGVSLSYPGLLAKRAGQELRWSEGRREDYGRKRRQRDE